MLCGEEDVRMSVQEVEQAQRALSPQDDLAPYAGQWVALRNGHVVASGIDPESLREDPAVEPDDVIVPVSDADGGYFL
jgi:hypothetical protein